MNLAHLYYFRKLVELGSYSMAAKELYIAQPTLSLAISNIEKELSTVLVKKKRGNLELTVDGKELFEAAVIATNAVDNAVTLIRERGARAQGKLRIGSVVFNPEPSLVKGYTCEQGQNKLQRSS